MQFWVPALNRTSKVGKCYFIGGEIEAELLTHLKSKGDRARAGTISQDFCCLIPSPLVGLLGPLLSQNCSLNPVLGNALTG